MRFNLLRLPLIGRILQRLGLNAVPATGFFAAGWSAGTTVMIYWLETVLMTATTAVVIALHRRLSRKAGHWISTIARDGKKRAPARAGETFLTSFLGTMTPFTVVHGIFVTAIGLVILPRLTMAGAGISGHDLRNALPWLGALVLIGLLIDLVGLRDRPFAWVERTAQRVMGRMLIIHVTIVFGMFALAVTDLPRAFFAVFIVLKTLADLGGVLPPSVRSETPPRWLGWVERVKKSKNGESFEAYWRRTTREEKADEKANEELFVPGSTVARPTRRRSKNQRARKRR